MRFLGNLVLNLWDCGGQVLSSLFSLSSIAALVAMASLDGLIPLHLHIGEHSNGGAGGMRELK